MKRFSSKTYSVYSTIVVMALALSACKAPPPRVAFVPKNNPPIEIEALGEQAKEAVNEVVKEADKEAKTEAETEANKESEGEKENEAAEEVMERKGREELYRLMRVYPGEGIPERVMQKANAVKQTQLAAQAALNLPEATLWQSIGPAPIVDELMGDAVKVNAAGRITAILVHPQDANIVYAAAAQGGVWKTTNGGESWTAMSDGQPSLAMGTLAFDPNNAEIIYAGTGEPHGSDSFYGAGILKSSNGGTSWTQLGADTFAGLGISNIVVSRNDPNTLYVTASSAEGVYTSKPPAQRAGIYKSTNGGSTWTRIYEKCSGQGVCDSPSALVVSPTDPNTLYAGIDFFGVIKTTNGGTNWTNAYTPQSDLGRVEVAISSANANVLYAGLEVNTSQGSDGYMFRSTNGGTSWEQLTGSAKPLKVSYCGGQCSYDNFIALHPTNANIVFAGGNGIYSDNIPGIDGVLFKTGDGGNTWTYNNGLATNTTLHPDLHAIAFAKSNPNTVWVGTDGGVYRSTDGGATWQERNNGLATLQFQSVALHPTNPLIAFGGMQDNSKAKTTGSTAWTGLDRGDGGFAAIDPFDPKYFYGTRFSISRQFVQFQRNSLGGTANSEDWPQTVTGIQAQADRVLFYVPFAIDPNTAGRLYLGTNRMYRTNNRGDSWTPISSDLTKGSGRGVSAIHVMKGNANVVLAGTSDGNVQVTTNGGTTWTNLTKSPLPNRFVSDVAVENEQTFYAAFNGFNENTASTPGHVFKTTNGGTTWSNVSKDDQADGLPNVPVQALVLDGSAVYVGTDLGVYRSTNGGNTWEPFSQGLPNVAVFDLALQKYASGAKVLLAATHGRSIWRVVLEGDIAPVLKNKVYLPFIVRNAVSTPVPTATPGPSPTALPTQPPATPTQPAGSTATPIPTSTPSAGNTATPLPTSTPSAGNTATPIPTPTQAASNTATPAPTATIQPGSGSIQGQVRYQGTGVSNIALSLLLCDSAEDCNEAGTTQTDSTGQYRFNNPASLATGQHYHVYYDNPLPGNNNYLSFWQSFAINTYTAGSTTDGGSFDIADVKLASPDSPATETLPATFSWLSRGISSDKYSFAISNVPVTAANELCFSPLQSGLSYSFTLADGVSCGLSFNKQYAWYVYVANGTWANGYGGSRHYNYVTFINAVAQTSVTNDMVSTEPGRMEKKPFSPRHNVNRLNP